MASHGRLDRYLRRFGVAHFPQHDDVRILTEDRAERCGEGHTRLAVNGDLRDTRQLVFDGVFDRENFFGGGVTLLKRRVERCGLTAAGGTRHEDHPVRASGQPSHAIVDGAW